MNDRLMDVVTRRGVTFQRAFGSRLYDNDGRDYIDFFADSGALSLGYTEVAADIARSVWGSPELNPVHVPLILRFARREGILDRLCSATSMEKVYTCCSGSEAVEVAIKLARLYQYKSGNRSTTIYTTGGAYHGRTYGALAAGDSPPYHTEGFGPLPRHFQRFNDPDEIEDAAAILISPVKCTNDVVEYPAGWLRGVRERADRTGALVIYDEIQTGMGRSGAVLYSQRGPQQAQPDVVVLGKGMAGGMPMASVLARGPASRAFTPGTQFSTFGGNQLGLLGVEYMLSRLTPAFLQKVEHNGRYIANALADMRGVGRIRQVGMMVAFDCLFNIFDVAEAAMDKGLIVGAFRKGVGAIKITPPLNIDQTTMDYGLDRLSDALRSVR